MNKETLRELNRRRGDRIRSGQVNLVDLFGTRKRIVYNPNMEGADKVEFNLDDLLHAMYKMRVGLYNEEGLLGPDVGTTRVDEFVERGRRFMASGSWKRLEALVNG